MQTAGLAFNTKQEATQGQIGSEIWNIYSALQPCLSIRLNQQRSRAKLQCTKVLFLFFIEQIDKAGCQECPDQL